MVKTATRDRKGGDGGQAGEDKVGKADKSAQTYVDTGWQGAAQRDGAWQWGPITTHPSV